MLDEEITQTSYMCKYNILDQLLKNIIDENQTVCIYFDTRNVLSRLHQQEEQIRLNKLFISKSDRYIVARTIILLANHWIRYFKKRNINCILFFFDDRGPSEYHMKYSNSYKIKRKIKKQRIIQELLLDEDFYDNFSFMYETNMNVVSNIFSILNNVFYVGMENIESDFTPKFIMEEYFSKDGKLDDKYTHIIVGNDKDFGQILTDTNIYQLLKNMQLQTFELRDKTNVLEKFCKMNFDEDCILRDPKFIPILLSLSGDEADSVKGIKGLGPYKNSYNFVNQLLKDNIITLDDYKMEDFLNKIKEYNKINPSYFNNVTSKKILSNFDQLLNNYKLTSFEELIDWLPYTKRKQIKNTLNKRSSSNEERYKILSELCINKNTYSNLI